MSERKLLIPITIPESYLMGILTTAAEGGISYWATCKRVDRDEQYDVYALREVASVEDIDDFEPQDVTCETVMRGLAVAVLGEREELIGRILREHQEGDGLCGLDAEDCDVIVQLGMFGEVVYG